MQSKTKFIDLAKEISRRDRALFDSLLKFEETKKIRTKERLNFTIDKTISSEFKKYCRDKGYNMSAKIEQAMKGIISN